jgi:hypothetical protein
VERRQTSSIRVIRDVFFNLPAGNPFLILFLFHSCMSQSSRPCWPVSPAAPARGFSLVSGLLCLDSNRNLFACSQLLLQEAELEDSPD